MKVKNLIERLQRADPDGELDIFVTPLMVVNNINTQQPQKIAHPEIKYIIEEIVEVKDIFSDMPSRFLVLGFDETEYISKMGDSDLVN